MTDGTERLSTRLNGWMIVVIVLILAAAAVAITALVTRGSQHTPLKSSVQSYSTGKANDGWPFYDVFSGN